MRNTIAVSTWSLHRVIGTSLANGPGSMEPFQIAETWGKGAIDIFGVPQALALRDYRACEICHFHIGSWADRYLADLRKAFDDAGVRVQTLLIDDGDVTNSHSRTGDLVWIKRWIDAAAKLGSTHARVIAGKQKPTPDNLALSVAALKDLVEYGQLRGVAVVTENWFELLATPAAVHHVLDRVPGLGFMADTGNWSGPAKYDDLASIFARATLCHAKAHFDEPQQLDKADFAQCMAAAQRGSYVGPMTLIFADDGDEWEGLEKERSFIGMF